MVRSVDPLVPPRVGRDRSSGLRTSRFRKSYVWEVFYEVDSKKVAAVITHSSDEAQELSGAMSLRGRVLCCAFLALFYYRFIFQRNVRVVVEHNMLSQLMGYVEETHASEGMPSPNQHSARYPAVIFPSTNAIIHIFC